MLSTVTIQMLAIPRLCPKPRHFSPQKQLFRAPLSSYQTRTLSATSTALARSPSNADIPKASVHGRKTLVKLPGGRELRYDNTFLFDHCRCPKCCHPETKQRLKTLSEIPQDISPTELRMDGQGLRVSWSTLEPHESFFPIEFLKRASYDPPIPRIEQDERILWSSKIAASPPSVSYNGIMDSQVEQSETSILKLLNKVHDFGFCFVTDVPATSEDTKALIENIAPIRHTHYGGFWSFTADLSHGDLAYSAEALPAHTDTTYFTDPAGLQIFHLLSHPPPGTGGTTLLVDGFYTASLLSAIHPESYNTLSRLAIPAHASGTAGTMLRPPMSRPVFVHDEHRRLAQVRWNNEDRGVLGRGWTPEEVTEWYKAAKEYEALLKGEDAEYWVQLGPGTALVIDNWRVMHGRSEFTGARTMCGAYVGADDWLSRRNVLSDRHGQRRKKEATVAGVWSVGW
ncbi:trimethyllysine dioxygenase [Cryptococcus sp. DSM 104548]